jgi:hypothetical protein
VDDADGKGLPEKEFDFNTNLTGTPVATFDARRVHFTLVVRVY